MRLPLLKYYLVSSFSMKLRLHLVKQEGYVLEKILLEEGDRPLLECLFYAPTDASDPLLLQSIQQILLWLKAYLAGEPLTILPPLLWPSSSFALLTLTHLKEVPFGVTRSYEELAISMDHPRAARAVGSALNKNPFPLILPCHRIVSKKDGLGGFACSLSLKKLLLDFETSALSIKK